MPFELSVEKEKELVALCQRYAVRSLKLFGSAARGDYDPGKSDLDLLVEFRVPPEGMRPSTQFFGFLEDLEKLAGKKIDLLEEHAIENRFLKESALGSAVVLYAA